MLAALFVKKQFSIRREIITQLPVERVFNYVRRLKNQDRYSKWVMSDPAMKKESSVSSRCPRDEKKFRMYLSACQVCIQR